MRTIRDCSVAVVGGAGFLGSHIVDFLINERNCRVLVIDNLVAGRREFVHPKAAFAHHDITESEWYLKCLFEQNKVEYVVNCAAYPYVPDSFARPAHVCNVNFMGAIKVINAAQESDCKGVLQISSAEIYGEGKAAFTGVHDAIERGVLKLAPPQGKIDERGLVVPHSSYGASKAAVDAYCQVAWRERKTPVIALRQFNVVGERDILHPYIVPEIYRQLQRFVDADFTHHRETYGKGIAIPPVKLGNNSFRDFIYAGDQARMAVELLEKGEFGEVFNLGSETGIKIYDLAQLIGKIMGFADVRVEQDQARVRPWEIWSLKSDNSKIYSVIESRPQVDLEEALRRTIAWYRDNTFAWPW